MPPRLSPLNGVPIGFAHRGAKAHAPENTLDAFELAKQLGATGIETDIWLTADGEAVLDHDGEIGGMFRKRPIRRFRRNELPDHIPTLDEYYDAIGTDLDLSIDMKDPDVFDVVIASARNAGGDAEHRLWLCHWQIEQIIGWRSATEAKLVDSTRLSKIQEGPERRAARQRDRGIDAVNLRNIDWTGGLVALFHRFDRLAMGWDAQHPRELITLLDAGIDAVFSDHVDRMMAAIEQIYPRQQG